MANGTPDDDFVVEIIRWFWFILYAEWVHCELKSNVCNVDDVLWCVSN